MHYTKIWVSDSIAPPNETYYRADTINKAKNCILYNEENHIPIEEIAVSLMDIGYARQADGGNIPNFLSWLYTTGRNYKIVRI